MYSFAKQCTLSETPPRFRMIGELELEPVMTVDQSNTVEFGGCFPYMGVQRSLHKLPARSGKPNSTRLIDRMHLVDPARFTASNRKRRGPVELWVIIISWIIINFLTCALLLRLHHSVMMMRQEFSKERSYGFRTSLFILAYNSNGVFCLWQSYSKEEFMSHFGGHEEWIAAPKQKKVPLVVTCLVLKSLMCF